MTEEELKEARSKPNFKKEDYPYSIFLPFSKIKMGMRIIRDGGGDIKDTVYFMYEVDEVRKRQAIDLDGRLLDCYVIMAVAFDSKDNIIYQCAFTPYLAYGQSFESFDEEVQEEVFFTSVEDAKRFGIDESQLNKVDWNDECHSIY